MDPLRHIPDILVRFQERSDHEAALNYQINDTWISFSSQEVLKNIRFLALALSELGIKKGDRIGIYAKSSPYWSQADFAIALLGAVTVPFFTNLSEEHFLFEAKQAEPKWIFVGDKEDFFNIAPHQELFQGIISLEQDAKIHTTYGFQDLIEIGSALHKKNPKRLIELEQAIDPEDLATIIYTSGSTGNPKGVELTHKNLVSIIHYDEFLLSSNDKFLSILPLAHIFSKQVHYIMMAWGVPIYFLNDLKKIPTVCQQIPITRMITVPRVLEKAYSSICEKINESFFLQRAIGNWALSLAHQEDSFYKHLMFPIADRLVYSKIRHSFGENFHSILTGGAALSPHLHRFFLQVGIPIHQGWGLTEGSTIAVNRLEQNKIGTVGPPG